MNPDAAATSSSTPLPATPRSWRVGLAVAVLMIGSLAWFTRDWIGPRGQALAGFFCFLGLAASISRNLRAVNLRTLIWGIVLQVSLALLVTQVAEGRQAFEAAGEVVKKFLEFSGKGADFVFGSLSDQAKMNKVFEDSGFKGKGYLFAFNALPTIIFVSSFFSVLYYLGILQLIVQAAARVMRYLMQTSGPETISATANVFMGQTEAPLIVKPYVRHMSNSELLALMVGGMATISGALMAAYIDLGADAVAILTTSIMAAPCSLYLAKLVIPEGTSPRALTTTPQANKEEEEETGPVNVIDAAARGAGDGLKLALNVAAMLIAFIALIALVDSILGALYPNLSLAGIFSVLFAPVAFLLGINSADVPRVADLLGTKLVLNEFVAYTKYKDYLDAGELSIRTKMLATYALTGFANFSSIAIQLGGIGAMAPNRRQDLARLGLTALFVGFLVTLVNASLAGVFLPSE